MTIPTPAGWFPLETAPKNVPILGICHHASDPGLEPGSTTRCTTYTAHAEGGLGHVEDGPHVLVWGGEYTENDWEMGINVHIPDWWFRFDSDWEKVANPIGWLPIPVTELPKEPS